MDYFLGTIELLPYSFNPMYWYLCDGRSLPISGNEALFSLIGVTYGGNGTSNFNIPNMLGLEPIPGMNFYICYAGIYPSRS